MIKFKLSQSFNNFTDEFIAQAVSYSFNDFPLMERIWWKERLVELEKDVNKKPFIKTKRRLIMIKKCLTDMHRNGWFGQPGKGVNSRRIICAIQKLVTDMEGISKELFEIFKKCFIKILYNLHNKVFISNVIRSMITNYNLSIDIPKIECWIQTCDGNWEMKEDYEGVLTIKQRKFGYHSHPDYYDKLTPTREKVEGETLYGIEYEGVFPSERDFQNFCSEAKALEFEGGKLYDKRNFLYPTDDGSIRHEGQEFAVEWWTPPMCKAFALRFWAVTTQLLKKHGWVSDTETYRCGIHCHIDPTIFKDMNDFWMFVDKVYGLSAEKKKEIFNRLENSYCHFDTNNLYKVKREEVYEMATGEFLKSGEQAWKRHIKEVRYLKTGYDYRYNLINIQGCWYRDLNDNVIVKTKEWYDVQDKDYEVWAGTLEIRGWNGNVGPIHAIETITNLINTYKQI